jgi:hypothetical protein
VKNIGRQAPVGPLRMLLSGTSSAAVPLAV